MTDSLQASPPCDHQTKPAPDDSEHTPGRKSWASRSRAWISILLLTPAGVLAAFSIPYFGPQGWAAFGMETVGWGLFLAGAFSRWWATLYIGGRKSNTLICEGPYSITRNPLYFGTFLIVMSIAVMVHSLIFAFAVIVSSVLYLAITVPREERRLEYKHGPSFADYRRRVPIFFPRFSLYHSPNEILVQTNGLRAEFQRSLQWIWVPFLCQVVVYLRLQPWWPHLCVLP